MIEQICDATTLGASRLVLRPNRSASARQLLGFFVVQVMVALAVSLYAWGQGNVFAPLFAVAHAALVALALRVAWRRSGRFEVVEIGPETVEVRRDGGGPVIFSAHPYWVRLAVEEASGDLRLRLRSSGREVEVGTLLAPAERRRLAGSLRELIAQAGDNSIQATRFGYTP